MCGVVLFALLVAVLSGVAPAARVLLLPVDHTGHVNTFCVVGQQLQSRGHHVFLLATQRNRHVATKNGIAGLFPDAPSPEADYRSVEDSWMQPGSPTKAWRVLNFLLEKRQAFLEVCRRVTGDEATMARLRKEQLEIAVVDGGPLAWCTHVIAYKLGIPTVTLHPFHEPWRFGIPALPSHEGLLGVVHLPAEYSYTATFKNLMLYGIVYVLNSQHDDAEIREMAPGKPVTSYAELLKASGVHLVATDNTCVESPRLESPHVRFIGSTGASPAKPLPEPFASFAESAPHGLVVVSFGTFIKRVPAAVMQKMLAVFKRLPNFKFIMRYESESSESPESPSSNVLLTKWLPQNDLLGHPNTRLFIAHGGVNGQMESVYHGVPTLVLPMGADQYYNAQRAVNKHFGKTLDPFTCTPDELLAAITEILNDPSYAAAISKCSRISRSFPDAHDRIDFWIRHVLEFGSDHLKPRSLDLPLWRLFMLDFLLAALLIHILLGYAMYRCYRCCCRRSGKPAAKTKHD